MIYILLISVFTLFYLSYKRNRNFLFIPSVVCSASFIIGLFFLAIKLEDIKYTIGIETVFLVILGLIGVIVGERISNVSILFSHCTPTISKQWLYTKEFNIDKRISFMLFVFNCIIAYFFSKEIIRIAIFAQLTDLSNFSEIMASYRTAMMFGDSLEYNVSPIISQSQKIVTISAYLYSFIFIANTVKGVKLKSNIMNLLVPMPYLVVTYLSGGRIGFIKILAVILLFVYVCNMLQLNKRKFNRFLSKFKIYVIIALVGILTLFFSLRIALGRLSSKDTSFSNYITMYIGYPILNFDLYLKDNKKHDLDLSKSETFSGIMVLLNKLEGKKINNGLPFMLINNEKSLGNVYTPFRRYHHDFGIIGVFFMPFLMSLIFSILIKKSFFKARYKKIHLFNSTLWISLCCITYLCCGRHFLHSTEYRIH